MGAVAFRCGTITQKPIQDAIRERFVLVEYDATTNGPVPADKYPGLRLIREFQDICPWTRVAFGLQFVIEPGGQYMLSPGIGRRWGAKESSRVRPTAESDWDTRMKVFMSLLREAEANYALVRRHEPGSPEEAKAIQLLSRKIEKQWAKRSPRFVDADLFTDEMFRLSVGLYKRYPGALVQPEPQVRRQAAELLGRYAVRSGDVRFRPKDEHYEAFSVPVAHLLDDEVEEVRHAAAVALYRFLGVTLPDTEDTAALVDAVRALWDEAVAAAD